MSQTDEPDSLQTPPSDDWSGVPDVEPMGSGYEPGTIDPSIVKQWHAVDRPWTRKEFAGHEVFDHPGWEELEGGRILLPGAGLARHWKAIAADGRGHVLITGDTGTGKEELARLILGRDPRTTDVETGKTVIEPRTINCAGMESTFLISDLFGHEKGAFTGATKPRTGWLRTHRGGTLVLDELGVVSVHDQAKILRFMQTQEVQPLGSDEIFEKVDVRIIATTNVAPGDEDRLRADLRNRFKYEIHLPPLRERGADDLCCLLAEFLSPYKVFSAISVRWLLHLLGHRWPGNIRELKRYCDAAMQIVDNENAERRQKWEALVKRALENDRRAAKGRCPPRTREEIEHDLRPGNGQRIPINVLDATAPPVFMLDLSADDDGKPAMAPGSVAGRLLAIYEAEHGTATFAEPRPHPPNVYREEPGPDLVANSLRLLALLAGLDELSHPDELPLVELRAPPDFPKCYDLTFSTIEGTPASPCHLLNVLEWLVRLARDPEPLDVAANLAFQSKQKPSRLRSPSGSFVRWIASLPASIPDYGDAKPPRRTMLDELLRRMRNDPKWDAMDIAIAEGLGLGKRQSAISAAIGRNRKTVNSRVQRIVHEQTDPDLKELLSTTLRPRR